MKYWHQLKHSHHCFAGFVSLMNCKGEEGYIAHEGHSFGDQGIAVRIVNSDFCPSFLFPSLSFLLLL